jgi:hypothetical protein
MRLLRGAMIALALLAGLPVLAAAHGGWFVGVNLGFPYYYRPYYAYPYPYYYVPPPVVLPPPPYVVPQQTVQPAYPVQPQQPQQPQQAVQLPQPAPLNPAVVGAGNNGWFAKLRDPDDRVRVDAANQLGRANDRQAVEALAAALTGDRSAQVREASARALGLIGDAAALPALQRAAGADDDREVRASARFAADTIRDRLRAPR